MTSTPDRSNAFARLHATARDTITIVAVTTLSVLAVAGCRTEARRGEVEGLGKVNPYAVASATSASSPGPGVAVAPPPETPPSPPARPLAASPTTVAAAPAPEPTPPVVRSEPVRRQPPTTVARAPASSAPADVREIPPARPSSPASSSASGSPSGRDAAARAEADRRAAERAAILAAEAAAADRLAREREAAAAAARARSDAERRELERLEVERLAAEREAAREAARRAEADRLAAERAAARRAEAERIAAEQDAARRAVAEAEAARRAEADRVAAEREAARRAEADRVAAEREAARRAEADRIAAENARREAAAAAAAESARRIADANVVPAPTGRVERVVSGLEFAEGPVWAPGIGALLFSDIPNDRIMRWRPGQRVEVHARRPGPNGNALDPQGRLVTCQEGGRNVVRADRGGGQTVLAERHEGRRFNSPNDLAIARDGTIWFTDPPWGRPNQRAGKEIEGHHVYRIDPGANRAVIAIGNAVMPNGVALSPDGTRLYLADTGGAFIDLPQARGVQPALIAYSIAGADRARPRELWRLNTLCDGLCVDRRGNVYTTGEAGVTIWSPNGDRLGFIAVREQPANVTFGGDDGRTLFIAARTSIYAVPMNVAGF